LNWSYGRLRAGLWSQKFTLLVYAASILVVAIASWTQIDVQPLLRVPYANIRWIDVAILLNVLTAIGALMRAYALASLRQHGLISWLPIVVLLYVGFELLQLLRTLGVMTPEAQLSRFASVLTVFALLFFSYVKITPDIHRTLFRFSTIGAIVLIVTIVLEIVGLTAGFADIVDWERVSFDVIGKKETVSDSVLIPLVVIHALAASTVLRGTWRRALYALAFGAVFVQVVLTVHRGLLITYVLTIIAFVFITGKKSTAAKIKTTSVAIVVLLATFLFVKDTLASIGYDPIQTLATTYDYTVNTQMDGWDKGRFATQEIALAVWADHPWLGVGYDDLDRYGGSASPHNVFVSTLYYSGVVGLVLLLSILTICYVHTIRLWRISATLSYNERLLNRVLVFASWMWSIPLLTQEALWEKYSLSVQMIYFGIIIGLCHHYGADSENASKMV
jgi:O-antigen ligase